MLYKPVIEKNIREIVAEWDALAAVRYGQITKKIDTTFNEILLPRIQSLTETGKDASLLDVGCGVGILTSNLAKGRNRVVGVDPSKKSIEIANSLNRSQAEFINTTIEDFCHTCNDVFDVVVANMVLMDALNLRSFLASIAKMMHKNSVFVFSITHPNYWPRYCGYETSDWFDYCRETIIEAPFKISNDSTPTLLSTHVHRPISMYVNNITNSGMTIELLEEPMPDHRIQRMYPSPWMYPRYLIGRCRLKS